MMLQESIQNFREHVLRVGIQSKWDNHLTEPVHKNAAHLVRLLHEEAKPEEVRSAAEKVEAALMVCGSSLLLELPVIDKLIAEMHDILEAYEKEKASF